MSVFFRSSPELSRPLTTSVSHPSPRLYHLIHRTRAQLLRLSFRRHLLTERHHLSIRCFKRSSSYSDPMTFSRRATSRLPCSSISSGGSFGRWLGLCILRNPPSSPRLPLAHLSHSVGCGVGIPLGTDLFPLFLSLVSSLLVLIPPVD